MFVIKNRFTCDPIFDCDADTPADAVQMARDDGASLQYGDFSRMDLSHVNFSGLNLRDASSAYARLTAANFKDAALDSALFVYAQGVSTDFTGAVLRYANLQYAQLQQGNFTAADLHHADLRDIRLQHAVLTRANVAEAYTYNADIALTYRDFGTFSDQQLRHYRDGLCLLIHDYPALLTPLLNRVRATARQYYLQREVHVLEALAQLNWLCVEAVPGTINVHVFSQPTTSYSHICRWFEQFKQYNWTRELLESALSTTLLWLQMEENTGGGSIVGNTLPGVQTVPQARRLRLTGKEG